MGVIAGIICKHCNGSILPSGWNNKTVKDEDLSCLNCGRSHSCEYVDATTFPEIARKKGTTSNTPVASTKTGKHI